jgi:predicted N-acetyltransferase YhbS
MTNDMINIRTYSKNDEAALFDMIRKEGAEWEDYWGVSGVERYRKALDNSVTFVACNGNEMYGYVRCKDDYGFGVYIYDLLVSKSGRGRNLGRALMEKVCKNFPNDTVYVMSDVDEYYEKQGYRREGSIFKIIKNII